MNTIQTLKRTLPVFVMTILFMPSMASSSEVSDETKVKQENGAIKIQKPEKIEAPQNKAKKPNSTIRVNFRHNPNRYVFHFLAWIDEPYIAYRVIADPYSGRVHRVPVVRYNRILVRVYLDRVSGTYGYFDRFGNPVPYLPNRYQYRCVPF